MACSWGSNQYNIKALWGHNRCLCQYSHFILQFGLRVQKVMFCHTTNRILRHSSQVFFGHDKIYMKICFSNLSWSFLLLCHVTRPSHTAFPFQVNEPDRLWVCPRYVAAFSSLLHHFLIVTRLTGYHVIFFWQVFLPIFYICYCLTFLDPPFLWRKEWGFIEENPQTETFSLTFRVQFLVRSKYLKLVFHISEISSNVLMSV